ncbi:hypothetical protein DL768_010546 [Monosporascus sp. mg162]|nr:hypothetical protein DL768_010546 [Monosporascus sp. mg162]
MANMNEDFNSSDPSDLDEPQPEGKWTHLGQLSIQSMLESALQIRRDTKVAVRRATFHSSDPGKEVARARWYNRFMAFRQDVLRVDSSTIPTGEDLERFELVFRLEAFALSKREVTRLGSAFEDMLAQKLLTRDETRERMWITSDLVRQMATAMLQHGLDNGTPWWDHDILRATCLVLQAALVSRAGDVQRSTLRAQEQCLAYRDITIRLESQEDGTEGLLMTVVLRFCKVEKDNPVKNKTVELSDLRSPAHNPVDPVLLVLIWALRTGAVRESSWSQLLENMRKRRSKKVVWAHPERPLFCSIQTGKPLFDFGRSARHDLNQRAVVWGAKLIGLLHHPRSHDLRRGAAMELKNMKSDELHQNEAVVRESLGHSRTTQQRGISDAYAGHNLVDTWALRVRDVSARAAPNALTRDRAASSYVEPRKRSREEIDDACERYNLDPNVRKDRTQAAKRLKSDSLAKWRSEQRALLDGPDSTDGDEGDNQPEQTSSCHPELGGEEEETETSHDSLDLTLVDPALISFSDTLAGSAAPMNSDIVDTVILSTTDQEKEMSITTLERDAFVELLSTINVRKFADPAVSFRYCEEHDVPLFSRDPPAKFKTRCPHAKFGCHFSSDTSKTLKGHVRACKFTSLEAAQSYLESNPFTCDSCSRRFPTEHRLKRHACNWTPRKCRVEGCTSSEIFETRVSHDRHRQDVHRGLPARKCPIPGCPRGDHVFRTWHVLKGHLGSQIHGLTKDEINQYRPAEMKAPERQMEPQKCSFPNCKTRGPWKMRNSYKHHLKTVHGVPEDDVSQYIKTAEELALTHSAATDSPDRIRGPITPQQCSHDGCKSIVVFTMVHTYAAHLKAAHGVTGDLVYEFLRSSEDDLPGRVKEVFRPQTCSFPHGCGKTRVWETKRSYRSHLVSFHKVDRKDVGRYIRSASEDQDDNGEEVEA